MKIGRRYFSSKDLAGVVTAKVFLTKERGQSADVKLTWANGRQSWVDVEMAIAKTDAFKADLQANCPNVQTVEVVWD